MGWALASSPQLRLQEARIKLVDNAPGLEGPLEDIVNRQDESPQRTSTYLGASSADRDRAQTLKCHRLPPVKALVGLLPK